MAKVAGITFSDSDSAPVPKVLNPGAVPEIFHFEYPTLVQTPAAIIDAIKIYPTIQALALQPAV